MCSHYQAIKVLPPDSYDHWVQATALQSMEFMRQYPTEWLLAQAEAPAQRSLLA